MNHNLGYAANPLGAPHRRPTKLENQPITHHRLSTQFNIQAFMIDPDLQCQEIALVSRQGQPRSPPWKDGEEKTEPKPPAPPLSVQLAPLAGAPYR
jgi:hypothetical protein